MIAAATVPVKPGNGGGLSEVTAFALYALALGTTRAILCLNMKIYITSIHVSDQGKALSFYTDVLGFQKKEDQPLGKYRWVTVTSPEEPDGVELLLEPGDNPAARTYQKSLYKQGIPAASFAVSDIHDECRALEAKGVKIVEAPKETGPVLTATIDDTCGNYIQLVQLL